MVHIEIQYEGQLRCAATHGPSKAELLTDAPVDNQGRGLSFSPTDLLATALGTCMLTIMGIRAESEGIDLGAATASVKKHMVASPRRRIGRLDVLIRVPIEVDDVMRAEFELAALTCPVKESVDAAINLQVRFLWGAEA